MWFDMQAAGCLPGAMDEVSKHDQGDGEEEKNAFQDHTSVFIFVRWQSWPMSCAVRLFSSVVHRQRELLPGLE